MGTRYFRPERGRPGGGAERSHGGAGTGHARAKVRAGPGEARVRPGTALVPEPLRGLVAVAAAVVTREGVLLDANRVFLDLLPGTNGPGDGPGTVRRVRDAFIEPQFDELAERRGAPAEGVVYRGPIRIGAPRGPVHALRASVHRRGDRFLVVGEQDVPTLEHLGRSVLQLVDDLTRKHREILRLQGGRTRAQSAGEGAEEGADGALGAVGARHESFPPKALLFEQGQPSAHVFAIADGWVAMHHVLPNGARQVLDFALAGDVVGVEQPEGPMEYTAECLSRVEALAFPRERIDDLVTLAPDVAAEIIRVGSASLNRARDLIINVSRRTARERVAHLLLELFRRTCKRLPAEPGETAHLPLTQALLADALGLSAAHVNRVLRALRCERIVEMRAGTLTVLDPDALLEVAFFER